MQELCKKNIEGTNHLFIISVAGIFHWLVSWILILFMTFLVTPILFFFFSNLISGTQIYTFSPSFVIHFFVFLFKKCLPFLGVINFPIVVFEFFINSFAFDSRFSKPI